MNQYCRLIPRLNGAEITGSFDYYLGLVKKGVAGFIVFGGDIGSVREGLKELREKAKHPLLIMSDLEQGLGQQINGGTIFPPAMAVASALEKKDRQSVLRLLKKLYTAFAVEARYIGMDTILAPVLDINTNPENPIIATRSFGEDPETVSFMGSVMIQVLQSNGIAACAKHFPGHGDTKTDSHISLPVIKKSLSSLEKHEISPFRAAVREGVSMMMLGHLSVPSLEPSGLSVSLSKKAVSYIRQKMGFKGMLITDALNMGGLDKYSEGEAALMSLMAGVDLILHPTDPDNVAAYLHGAGYAPQPLVSKCVPDRTAAHPDFNEHKSLSAELAGMSLRVEGSGQVRIEKPFLIMLSEDADNNSTAFADEMKKYYPLLQYCEVPPGGDIPWHLIPPDFDVVVAVFSEVKAWKGGMSKWLIKILGLFGNRVRVFISFGNPYILRHANVHGDAQKICAFWNSAITHKAVAERLTCLIRKPGL